MKERGTTGAGELQITGVPRVYRHLKRTHGTGNDILLGRTGVRHSGTRPLTPRAMVHGDGRGEVIPSCDGTDFRLYERRVRLSLSNTRLAPERRAGKLVQRLEGRAFDSCEGIQDLETPNGVENLLDHLRIHFEPIEVFRRGRIVDDFVFDFERQPGEKIGDNDTRFNIL